MLPRRHFLQAGLSALAAMPVIGGLVRPAQASAAPRASGAGTPLPLHLVIYDEHLPESLAFAQAAAAHGARTRGYTRGDATPIWYDDIDLAWRQRPVAIAGLTRHGPLFVFEQMAQVRGLRVVARAQHSARADGRCEHVIASQPGEATAWVEALAGRAGQAWPEIMGGLVIACRAQPGQGTRARVTTAAAGADLEEPLFTWVIAPATD